MTKRALYHARFRAGILTIAVGPKHYFMENWEKNIMEKALEKLAEQILSFDEASLTILKEKYRLKIEHFDGTKNWEKAGIIYCMINAVNMKNTLFNENVLKKVKDKEKRSFRQRRGHPDLKRVK